MGTTIRRRKTTLLRILANMGMLFALLSAALVAPAQAQTTDLPDLIVTDILQDPPAPRVGDIVKFSAVVKNQGAAATPEDVVTGVVFFINNAPIGFTDKYTAAIPAGASVTLAATGAGAFGTGDWLARTGTFTVGALVDDVNRIPESDNTNNFFNRPQLLEIAEEFGPDLVVSDLAWTPQEIRPGVPILFTATITNTGNRPAPAGVVVQFNVDQEMIARSRPTQSELQPGASITVMGVLSGKRYKPPFWRPRTGEYDVSAVADPDNAIAEIREDNNTRVIDLVINQQVEETAKPSDSFVDSIGVATHVQYFDTSYGDYEGIFKPRLLESGIRYIRDGTYISNTLAISRFNDLAANGVRMVQVMDPKTIPLSQVTAVLKSMKPSIFAVEGPNEPNIFNPDLFPDVIRNYHNQMYDIVKSDPETAHLPVLAPSLAYGDEDSDELGPVKCDYGNTHSYTGGQIPDVGLDDKNLPAALEVCPGKPVWATETGYNTAINTIFGQPGISDAATAKYMPRMYLEHFIRGVPHTFAYEFLDEKPNPEKTDPEQHFGMVRYDGTPKPSFYAIKNIIDVLEDPGAAFETGSLEYRLSGNVTNLKSLLLQKRNGRYYLVLWLNAHSYDLGLKQDANIPTQSVTITLNRPVRNATTYLPSRSTESTQLGLGRTFTLNVPDEPLVVELTPIR